MYPNSLQPTPWPQYMFLQGLVTNIQLADSSGCAMLYQTIGTDGLQNDFLVFPDTYFIGGIKVTPGMKIIAYYDKDAPMLPIYPPQYRAVAVAPAEYLQNVKIDRFDNNLVSQDNSLKLNIGPKTDIVLENGQDFQGILGGRDLIVLYGSATRSIPSQTTPDKIIVLCR